MSPQTLLDFCHTLYGSQYSGTYCEYVCLYVEVVSKLVKERLYLYILSRQAPNALYLLVLYKDRNPLTGIWLISQKQLFHNFLPGLVSWQRPEPSLIRTSEGLRI